MIYLIWICIKEEIYLFHNFSNFRNSIKSNSISDKFIQLIQISLPSVFEIYMRNIQD